MNTLLQGTETLRYRAQKYIVTAHRNTLLQRTSTLCYNAKKNFVTAHRNTLLQRTETLCYRAQKHFVTAHRNTLLQRTETLLQGTETLCYSAQKRFHRRRKRSEKRKHIHPEDGVLIRRTAERIYVPGDWIMPAPWAKISVTVKHHPLSNPACCTIVYLGTQSFPLIDLFLKCLDVSGCHY
jgi:hypothetical protein